MVLNILVILLVGLIAYWWGNQGLFSAILHLLCVIAAAVIAFAFWEPLVIGVFLSGGDFDNFAWGVSLIGLFVVALFTLRMTMDRIVRANVILPQWANMAFGLPIGAAAGIITMGVLVIGAGFIQSTRELMGYTGPGRSAQTGKVQGGSPLWLPVHTITSDFMGMLSVGSMSTSTPMLQYYPDLDRQSSLVRDTWKNGRAALAMAPKPVKVTGLFHCADTNRWAVAVHFDSKAMDYGERLILSASQIRLIASARGAAKPAVEHPEQWTQDDGSYVFDDITHYATSVAGQQSSDMVFEFPATKIGTNNPPKFIQIKGTRFRLPAATTSCDFAAASGGGSRKPYVPDPSAPQLSADDLKVTNRVPFQASTNQLPAGISQVDGFLTRGKAEFPESPGSTISRALRVEGISEAAGTRILQLNVSRGATADIYTNIRTSVPPDSAIELIDSDGNAYKPLGYVHEHSNTVTVDLRPGAFIQSFKDLPILPSAGDQVLKLVFAVTEGKTIVAFRVGDKIVANCNVVATK